MDNPEDFDLGGGEGGREDDPFKDVPADPLADSGEQPQETVEQTDGGLPPGVEAGQLPDGYNPSEGELPPGEEPPPEEVLGDPEAQEPEPAPEPAEPEPEPETSADGQDQPGEGVTPDDPGQDAEVAGGGQEPPTGAIAPEDEGGDPPPEEGSEPAATAPPEESGDPVEDETGEPEGEKKAEEPKQQAPKSSRKKGGKKKAATPAEVRGYVILQETEPGKWEEVFPRDQDGEPYVVEARYGKEALAAAYKLLTEDQEGEPPDLELVATPRNYFRKKTVSGKRKTQQTVSVG